MARGDNDAGYVTISGVKDDIAERFYAMCARKDAEPGKMFETMVRSFDRGSQTYGLDMRLDFGKYSGMLLDDVIRTDTRYISWLVRESAWFKLDSAAERLLRSMEG